MRKSIEVKHIVYPSSGVSKEL